MQYSFVALHATKKNIVNSNFNYPIKIAIHPFASQDCKIWKNKYWIELIEILITNKFEIYIVSSSEDLELAKNIFSNISKDINFISESISNLHIKLQHINLLIGLDSFAVHFAESVGIKTITIVGSNPSELWRPPNGVSITTPNSICKYKPCFNKPKCISTHFEYACINKIKPEDVYRLVIKVLFGAPNGT